MNPREFLDFRMKSFIMPSDKERQALRERLAKDKEEYFARGGKITYLADGATGYKDISKRLMR